MACILLVMSLELICSLYNLTVEGVLNSLFDGYDDGLVHLIAGHLTGTGLS